MEGVKTVVRQRIVSIEPFLGTAPCAVTNGCSCKATHVVRRSDGSWTLACAGHIQRVIEFMKKGYQSADK